MLVYYYYKGFALWKAWRKRWGWKGLDGLGLLDRTDDAWLMMWMRSEMEEWREEEGNVFYR